MPRQSHGGKGVVARDSHGSRVDWGGPTLGRVGLGPQSVSISLALKPNFLLVGTSDSKSNVPSFTWASTEILGMCRLPLHV